MKAAGKEGRLIEAGLRQATARDGSDGNCPAQGAGGQLANSSSSNTPEGIPVAPSGGGHEGIPVAPGCITSNIKVISFVHLDYEQRVYDTS